MSSTTANTSLYVKNINWKVKKPGMLYELMSELRRQLYSLFGSYGKVIDVVATRAEGQRGQAFVVFRDLQSATAALRGLEGFEFYEKPLSLAYARTRSKATIVAEHGEEALLRPDLMQKRADGTAAVGRVTYSNAQGEARGQDKKRVRDDASASRATVASGSVSGGDADERPLKTARTSDTAAAPSATEADEEEDDDDDVGAWLLSDAAMDIGDSDSD